MHIAERVVEMLEKGHRASKLEMLTRLSQVKRRAPDLAEMGTKGA